MAREFTDEELELLAAGGEPVPAASGATPDATPRPYSDAELEALASREYAVEPPATNANTTSNLTTLDGVANVVGRQALGQGLALGFGDEIEAGARSLFSDRSYGDIVREIRGQNREYERANPWYSGGAQVLGGAITGLGPGALVARGVAGLGRAGQILANPFTVNATKGGSMLGVAGQGAKVGATYGTIAGFGSGEATDQNQTEFSGLVDRAKKATFGAGVGALTGGALAPAASAIGGAVVGVSKYARRKAAGEAGQRELDIERAARAFNRDNIDAEAARRAMRPELDRSQYDERVNDAIYEMWAKKFNQGDIVAELNRRSQLPDTHPEHLPRYKGNQNYGAKGVARRFNESAQTNAVPRTIVDVASEQRANAALNLQREQELGITLGGEGASDGAEKLFRRQQSMRDRVRGHVEQELGVQNLDAAQRKAAQQDDLREFARAEYDELRQNPVVLADKIGNLEQRIEDLRGDELFDQTERRLRQLLGRKDPSARDRSMFSFDVVNEIQKALGKRARNHNLDPVERDFYGRARDEFLDIMDDFFSTPNASFAEVRGRYRDARRVIEAGEQGAEVGKKTTMRARMAEQDARNLTGDERREYVLSAADEWLTGVDRKKPHQDAAADFTTDAARKRLTDLLGPDAADRVLRKMEQESGAARRVNKIFNGSRTAPLQNAMERFGEQGGMAADMFTGNWLGFAKKAAAQLAERWRAGDADGVARMLSETDPAENYLALLEIERTMPRMAAEMRNFGILPAEAMAAGIGTAWGSQTPNNQR